MADRWMDERDRRWRERGWRRSEEFGRGERDERRYAAGEDRSWGGPGEEDEGRYYGGRRSERERVFGERESGMGYGGDYGRERERGWRSGGGQGAGEGYRESYGRMGGGRSAASRSASGQGWRSAGWQDRDFGGVSPAMEHDEYDAEREAQRYEERHGYGQGGRYDEERGRDYGQGGRYYGDDRREPIYRQQYGQGGVEYGEVPRGYDAERERWGEHRRGRFDEGYDTRMFATGGMASGGTGGYDYERGYGDAGRTEQGRREERGERWERGGRDAGDFLRRAGERVASWFGGGERHERDFRGMGPKGYKRNDERISDEVHERLTDDPWVDASNISVSVSGGEVTLSGTVENRESKHRAERIVEDISGVNHVQNNLRIERGNPLTHAGSGYGDSVLEAQMRGQTGSGEDISGGTGTRRTSGGDGGKAR